MTLYLDELDKLKEAAIGKFDDRLAEGSATGSLERDVAHLQVGLEQTLSRRSAPAEERIEYGRGLADLGFRVPLRIS